MQTELVAGVRYDFVQPSLTKSLGKCSCLCACLKQAHLLCFHIWKGPCRCSKPGSTDELKWHRSAVQWISVWQCASGLFAGGAQGPSVHYYSKHNDTIGTPRITRVIKKPGRLADCACCESHFPCLGNPWCESRLEARAVCPHGQCPNRAWGVPRACGGL